MVTAMSDSVTVSKEINASVDTVFGLVSHLERMGEWSPEARGGSWIKGASGPAVGARFSGSNGNEKTSWKTTSIVTEMVSPTSFAFRVVVGPVKVAMWTYQIEQLTDSSCQVTHSWTDQRGLAKWIGKRSTGVVDRSSHNRANMEATLNALAVSASK
jgi:Polyketide cyclase / dehydrase and lipid transport